MTRGTYIPLTHDQRVDRAESLLDGKPTIQYCLSSGRNGGAFPRALHCASAWERKPGTTILTSDCVGFALWVCGVDRYQKATFPFWGGWMNTNSLVAALDADHPWVSELVAPLAGCLVVYPSYTKPLGKDPATGRRVLRRVMGHIGVYLGDNQVAHCHGPPLRGQAISVGTLEKWTNVKGHRFLDLNPNPSRRVELVGMNRRVAPPRVPLPAKPRAT